MPAILPIFGIMWLALSILLLFALLLPYSGSTQQFNFNHNFAYHCGKDDFYSEVTSLEFPINVPNSGTETLTLDLEVEKLWAQGVQPINLKTDNSTHTLNNEPLAEQFLGNFRMAFESN